MLDDHTGQSKTTGSCYNALVSAFFRTELKKMLYQQSLYFFLSEHKSTMLVISSGVQTIDRVAVYGFAINFWVIKEAAFWRVHL